MWIEGVPDPILGPANFPVIKYFYLGARKMTMDPLTLSIVSDLIANGVTTVFSHVYRRMKVDEKEGLHKRLESDETFGEIIQKAAATVAKELKGSAVSSSKLRAFMISPEAETAIRRIYSFYLSDAGHDLDLVCAEFIAAMAFNLGVDQSEAERIGRKVFGLLLAGVERALSFAVEHGSVSAHEALSARRFNLVKDEIAAVRQNLDFLTKRQKAPFSEIQDFESRLRVQVLARHSHIVPPHFDSLRRVPIDDLYVSSDLLMEPSQQGKEGGSIAWYSFLETMYRAVLLGDPGGGKSTFAQKVAHDLARHYSQRLLGGRLVTPILVILREYGAYKKENKCSILEYLEVAAKSLYQLTPPVGSLEYLLLNGRLIIIFDGLDELLDTSYRQEVSLDIELFCSLYSPVPVLVTSRKVGYEQAPLDPSKFGVVHLAPFERAQVEEYVEKWFSVQTDLLTDQRKKKVESFVAESAVVPDLRANPLMLALMCNIYRGEDYIPQNRPDVYEKCATMLFERWDKSRGIIVSLPFEAHIRPAMMYLAYWIYSHAELQSGVTEAALIDKAVDYLSHRRFDDVEEAREAAKKFIDFCRGRAWVFTDVGTTREGYRIYQFTHRTFLEYFTGAHLARIHETAEALGENLRPRILQREWDVVAQLAFQIKAKGAEGAADKLLGALVEIGTSNQSGAGLSALSFAARCLEFMVPSPLVTKAIIDACVGAVVKLSIEGAGKPAGEEDRGPEELLEALLSCSVENQRLVGRFLVEALLHVIEHGSEREAYMCLEAGLNLTLAGRIRGTRNLEFAALLSQQIYKASKEKIASLHSKFLLLSIHLHYLGDLTVRDLIDVHGVESLFASCRFSAFTRVTRASVGEFFLWRLSRPEFDKRVLQDLGILGDVLHLKPTPWFNKYWVRAAKASPNPKETRMSEQIKVRGSSWFGLFVLLGSLLEAVPDYLPEAFLEWVDAGEMRALLMSRLETVNGQVRKKRRGVFLGLDLLPAQELMVERWMAGEISFCYSGDSPANPMNSDAGVPLRSL